MSDTHPAVNSVTALVVTIAVASLSQLVATVPPAEAVVALASFTAEAVASANVMVEALASVTAVVANAKACCFPMDGAAVAAS